MTLGGKAGMQGDDGRRETADEDVIICWLVRRSHRTQ